MRRLRIVLVAIAALVALAIAAAAWLTPDGFLPLVASTAPASSREYGAALAGLLLIVFLALGLDWQDF